jgi:glycosyltransferase involved in cell wall biosynthesis
MIAPASHQGMNIVALLSDAFGGYGGISKFNRDLLKALDGAPPVIRTFALPRFLISLIAETIPESVIFNRMAARGKLAFVQQWFRLLIRFEVSPHLVICGHINLLPLAWLLARLKRSRLVLIIHGLDAWQPTGYFLVDWLAGRVDRVISVSQFSADRFSSWTKIANDRIFILPNCVDLTRFQPRNRDLNLIARYCLEGRRVLITVGRLAATERYKGVDEVLMALPRLLKKFPDLAYLIVGEGDDRPRLETKVRSLGLNDSVIFAGQISEEEKAAHYNLADLYVMPSSAEGFGIVYLEAAACGVPIIGSTIDGSREALLDGELGDLVDPRNLDDLYEAIETKLLLNISRQRNPKIARFSEEQFGLRMNEWLLRIMGEINIDAITL